MRLSGRFGRFGGAYVPEILMPALEQLEAAFLDAQEDESFRSELADLLGRYAGRPTPLTLCRNLGGRARLYLKREDLLHGGAHKTNQVLAQALLARRMGKTRLIAETGAGQHGVATAMAGALFGLETRIYMGADDVERQQLNVFRMELMGAEVIPVTGGGRTLKDAVNEALRDWTASFADTHYLLGTVAGPHPFPLMVREFQRVIGAEARAQLLEAEGRLPDRVIACVGGGSNAMGIFADFVEDESVALIGVEAAGRDAFCRASSEAGADSLLVADVPAFEAEPFAQSARAAGLDPVLIAAANTPNATLERIARLGGGYTYCVARAGVTGAGESVHFDHRDMLDSLAEAGAPPPIFGFGISRPDHVEAALDAGAAGAISGSAIVRLVAEDAASAPDRVRRFVAEMKSATRRSSRI